MADETVKISGENEDSKFLPTISTVTNEMHKGAAAEEPLQAGDADDEERGISSSSPALPSTKNPKPPTHPRPVRSKIPKKRVPRKTCMAAIALVVFGIVLFALAIDFYVAHPDHAGALPVLILSFIVLLPGCYATTQIIGAIRGWRGFRLDNLPSYDDL